MKNEIKVDGGGIGFAGMLTLLFITLKLTGTIGWSWWWVLSPVWVPILVVIIVVAFFFGFAMLFKSLSSK